MSRRSREFKRRITLPLRWAILSARNLLGGKRRFSRAEALESLRRHRAATGELDRAQWRRWYKANRKWQRQLRASKQRGGGPIDPCATGLPRVFVP